MSTTYFWPGETVRVTVSFVDEAGQPLDVDGVEFKYRAPGSSSATTISGGSVVEESVGVFHADLPLPTAGDWAVRATCATPTASAVEIGFSVLPSAVL